MNIVDPIRNANDVENLKTELLKISYRDYILGLLGLNTGLRISDLIKLKVKTILQPVPAIKEIKTGKTKRIHLNHLVKQELLKYTANMQDDDFLFPSQKGGHISRSQAYRIFNKAAKNAGIQNLKIGTHTLRKTFGYHYYQQFKDIATLQKIFNHSSPQVTMRYIGLTDELIEDQMSEFFL